MVTDAVGGFWSSRIIITANNLQIFDHLTEPKDAPALAELIKSDPRATEVLLHALVALQLLKNTRAAFVTPHSAPGSWSAAPRTTRGIFSSTPTTCGTAGHSWTMS